MDRAAFERVAQHLRLVPADDHRIRKMFAKGEGERAADQSGANDCDAAEGGGHGSGDGPADGGSDDAQLGHEFFKLIEEERLRAVGKRVLGIVVHFEEQAVGAGRDRRRAPWEEPCREFRCRATDRPQSGGAKVS